MPVTKQEFGLYIKVHGRPERFAFFVELLSTFQEESPGDIQQLCKLRRRVCQGIIDLGQLGAYENYWGAALGLCKKLLVETPQEGHFIMEHNLPEFMRSWESTQTIKERDSAAWVSPARRTCALTFVLTLSSVASILYNVE